MTDSIDLNNLPNPDNILTYQEFVSDVHINKINVKRLLLEAVIAPIDVSKYLSKDHQINIVLTHEFKDYIVNDTNTFTASGLVKVRAKINKDTIFIIEVELIAEYDTTQIEKEITNNVYEAFIENNVPVNLWPYAREAIQSGSTKMGYPPLTIKPYRLII
ncbi:protein-export chaperone SecB [Sutcliffiella cohnii]|uniref:protein-export chaperone SecB n=1 Tax=Sutcliffiella cohnii TaxID=33932 RepID=UPI002E206E8B|nr:protein-export chaperone SecB [Sutcliffiella cohnii]MED4019140.1 protein-export chaperone SecB [Sutcliffiella cohnii]